MAAVENQAANVTLPLIRKHGLTPRGDADLLRSGREMARKAAKPWGELLAEFARDFPGYVKDFQRLETMAPPEDLPRLKLLTEHEIAAVAFLNLEISGEKNSVAPMVNYLSMDIE
jgi:dimethylamine/trimethylamine dehydrogenase